MQKTIYWVVNGVDYTLTATALAGVLRRTSAEVNFHVIAGFPSDSWEDGSNMGIAYSHDPACATNEIIPYLLKLQSFLRHALESGLGGIAFFSFDNMMVLEDVEHLFKLHRLSPLGIAHYHADENLQRNKLRPNTAWMNEDFTPPLAITINLDDPLLASESIRKLLTLPSSDQKAVKTWQKEFFNKLHTLKHIHSLETLAQNIDQPNNSTKNNRLIQNFPLIGFQRHVKCPEQLIWLSESCNWKQLRAGMWKKPLALLIQPTNGSRLSDLYSRGWKVVYTGNTPLTFDGFSQAQFNALPDVNAIPASDWQTFVDDADLIRIPATALNKQSMEMLRHVQTLIIEGTLTNETQNHAIFALAQSFSWHATVMRHQWGHGGADPSVVNYQATHDEVCLPSHDQDLYLSKENPNRYNPSLRVVKEKFNPSNVAWRNKNIRKIIVADSTIKNVAWFSPDQSVPSLAKEFPHVQFCVVEYVWERFLQFKKHWKNFPNIRLYRAPINRLTHWFDIRYLTESKKLPSFDLTILGSSAEYRHYYQFSKSSEFIIASLMKKKGKIITEHQEGYSLPQIHATWGNSHSVDHHPEKKCSVVHLPTKNPAPVKIRRALQKAEKHRIFKTCIYLRPLKLATKFHHTASLYRDQSETSHCTQAKAQSTKSKQALHHSSPLAPYVQGAALCDAWKETLQKFLSTKNYDRLLVLHDATGTTNASEIDLLTAMSDDFKFEWPSQLLVFDGYDKAAIHPINQEVFRMTMISWPFTSLLNKVAATQLLSLLESGISDLNVALQEYAKTNPVYGFLSSPLHHS